MGDRNYGDGNYYSANEPHSRKKTRYDYSRPTRQAIPPTTGPPQQMYPAGKGGSPMTRSGHHPARSHEERPRGGHTSPQRRIQQHQFMGQNMRSIPKNGSNPQQRKAGNPHDRYGSASSGGNPTPVSQHHSHRPRRDQMHKQGSASTAPSSSHHSRGAVPTNGKSNPMDRSGQVGPSMRTVPSQQAASRHRAHPAGPPSSHASGPRSQTRYDQYPLPAEYERPRYVQDVDEDKSGFLKAQHDRERQREQPRSRATVHSPRDGRSAATFPPRDKTDGGNGSNGRSATSANAPAVRSPPQSTGAGVPIGVDAQGKSPSLTNGAEATRRESSSPPPVLRQLVESLPSFDVRHRTLLPVSKRQDWFTLAKMGKYCKPRTNRKIMTMGVNLEDIGARDALGFGNLYMQFSSPWSNEPPVSRPDFILPRCYYSHPPSLKTSHLSRFEPVTLFYIFYYMPRDTLQVYAAKELCRRGYQYHEPTKLWITHSESGVMEYFNYDVDVFEMREFVRDYPEFSNEEKMQKQFMSPDAIEAL